MTMSHDQKTLKYIKNIAEARGTILNHVIVVERAMDEFLSIHFVGDNPAKKSELFELLSEETNFDTKRKNLERVVKSNYPEKYDKTVFSEFRELMEERNVFAHWLYDTTDESTSLMDDLKIRLFRFRTSRDRESNLRAYSSDDLNNILRKADRCLIYLTTFYLMGGPSSPDSSGPVT